ncbi:unnamed protein product [Mytilus coruscus]|uniref:PiggyBac transposable element-derived protein domain-containing protein n=1 Tax=Mytilus coruscus TaxID=42192 RepID=A0A6J8DE32_MYTCO|nr:unnamed protein product [Mytilus coruscus]
MNAILRFEFITCLVVAEQILSSTVALTNYSQKTDIDLIEASTEAEIDIQRLSDERGGDTVWESLFAPKNAQNLLYGNTPCEPSNAAVTPEPSAAGERFLFIRQRELMCVAYKERQNRKTVRFVTSAVKASAPAHGHKPVVSSIYSKNMGGVDLNDMMSGIYDDKRKTKTMWKTLAINIFHRMVLNAYIPYTKNTDVKLLSRLEFIQPVIDGLATEQIEHRQHRDRNVQAAHQPQRIEKLARGKQKNCIVCYRFNQRRRASIKCARCNKGLHGMCFHRHNCEE